jgi:erythromycin esterase
MRNQIALLLTIWTIPFVNAACAASQAQRATLTPTSAVPAQTAIDDPQLVTWLEQNAIPFKTTKPGSGFDDLQPLKSIVGNARIVALGQDTHGTHEFQAMTARLLEFLVEEWAKRA